MKIPISPGVQAASAFGWRPTTLVVPKVEKTRGLNLLWTLRTTSGCRGITLLYYIYLYIYIYIFMYIILGVYMLSSFCTLWQFLQLLSRTSGGWESRKGSLCYEAVHSYIYINIYIYIYIYVDTEASTIALNTLSVRSSTAHQALFQEFLNLMVLMCKETLII